nr:ADP-ribosylglycohydrolase family protein [Frondihabitans sucicola]
MTINLRECAQIGRRRARVHLRESAQIAGSPGTTADEQAGEPHEHTTHQRTEGSRRGSPARHGLRRRARGRLRVRAAAVRRHTRSDARGGAFAWEPGEWTDDTSMAIPLARAAARGDRFDEPEVLAGITREWVAWADDAPDVGTQTRQVLGRLGGDATEQRARDASQAVHASAGRSGGTARSCARPRWCSRSWGRDAKGPSRSPRAGSAS